jgi:DNA adenine methylase
MTDDNHLELLATLRGLKGMVIVTGYETDLYHDALQGWRVEKTKARISAGRGGALRTEVMWINQACDTALNDMHGSLFRTA